MPPLFSFPGQMGEKLGGASVADDAWHPFKWGWTCSK
jgi:hypothetical protein